ncbi:MAG: ABC transporter permease [Thermoplasmatota archaeon]|nr:ABC transporter permease [Candidatus Thermoplasmatota archaeon]MBU1913904.1 ABC transporter permease [Candidatus Thermoplasmatota archaeon]
MADLVSYIIRKLLLAIPVIFLATFIVFLMLYLTPGDPVTAITPPHVTPEQLDALREKYGFNDPFIVQYWRFLERLFHGDLGTSVARASLNTDVSFLLIQRLPKTLELMTIGLAISYSIGIPLGVFSALKQDTWKDRGVMVFTLVAYAMPSFWLGILLMMALAVYTHILPVEGTVGGFKSILLPALTLGLGNAALTTRMMRSSMLEVKRQDYITQLRSRGLPESEVIFKHALKNAILPVITVIGLDIGWFVAGAVVVETVFSWPGIGMLVTSSISSHDFPTVQGCILVLAFFVVIGNLVADILYALADPRVRLG